MGTFMKALSRKSFTLSVATLPANVYSDSVSHNLLINHFKEVGDFVKTISDDCFYTIDIAYTEKQKNRKEIVLSISIYENPKLKKIEKKFKELKSSDIFKTPDGEIKIKMGDTVSKYDINTKVMCLNGVVLPNLIPLSDGYEYRTKNGNRIDYTEEEILNLNVTVVGNAKDYV